MVLEAIKADTHGAIEWVYPKEEADKVIAELKKEKEYVIENTAEVINSQERELRHHKRKRCLAMARWCASRSVPWGLDNRWDRVAFYDKWKEIWLKLADKFKEVK